MEIYCDGVVIHENYITPAAYVVAELLRRLDPQYTPCWSTDEPQIDEVLAAWGFAVDYEEEHQGYIIFDFDGRDSREGAEELLFLLLAPYMRSGKITVRDDDTVWKYFFSGGMLFISQGTMQFSHPEKVSLHEALQVLTETKPHEERNLLQWISTELTSNIVPSSTDPLLKSTLRAEAESLLAAQSVDENSKTTPPSSSAPSAEPPPSKPLLEDDPPPSNDRIDINIARLEIIGAVTTLTNPLKIAKILAVLRGRFVKFNTDGTYTDI